MKVAKRNKPWNVAKYVPYARNLATAINVGKAVYQPGKAALRQVSKAYKKYKAGKKTAAPGRSKVLRTIKGDGRGTNSYYRSYHKASAQIKTAIKQYKPKVNKQILVGSRFEAENGYQLSWGWAYFDYSNMDLINADCLAHFENNPVEAPGGPWEPNRSFKSLPLKVWGNTMITNGSSGVVYLTIYDYRCKKDVPVLERTVTMDGQLNMAMTAWNNGSQNTEASDRSLEQMKVLGAKPTESELFRKYYTIEKTTKLVLGAGDTHKHNFYVELNKLMPGRQEGDNAATLINDLRHFGRGMIVTATGSPAAEVLGAGPGSTHIHNGPVTTLSPELLFIRERNISYSYLLSTAQIKYRTVSVIHNPFLGDTFAVRDEDGQVDTDIPL